MSTETVERRGLPLVNLTPTPEACQPIDEYDHEEPGVSAHERFQMVFSSAVLGGIALGVLGGVTGGTGVLAPVIATTALRGALAAGGAGAAIGAIRALSFDTPPREVSIFYSAVIGAIVGLTTGLFVDESVISAWEMSGAFVGMIEGWTEREIRRHLDRV